FVAASIHVQSSLGANLCRFVFLARPCRGAIIYEAAVFLLPPRARAAAVSQTPPLPLVGRGRGWGSMSVAPPCHCLPTPHPNPPPQGEREEEVRRAACDYSRPCRGSCLR